jgi:hypothetical protein
MNQLRTHSLTDFKRLHLSPNQLVSTCSIGAVGLLFDLVKVLLNQIMLSLKEGHEEMQTFLICESSCHKEHEREKNQSSAFDQTQQAESAPLHVHMGNVL